MDQWLIGLLQVKISRWFTNNLDWILICKSVTLLGIGQRKVVECMQYQTITLM
jgi:hypothetical protein